MERQPAIYILTNRRAGTLYTGVTSMLVARVWQHRNDLVPGFTQRYRLHRLVYYEIHESMIAAITREKQLKAWHRDWKVELIESAHPNWDDLWAQILK
jgi:putative endonuclease